MLFQYINFNKIIKSTLALLFLYKILNYIRNHLFRPIFYDIFFTKTKGGVCIIAPYYSMGGLKNVICEYLFENSYISIKPLFIKDPEKNCLIVLFKIPDISCENFEYFLKKGKKVLHSDKIVHKKNIKNKIAITTLFKYEKAFLKEWIDYHIKFGIEHFYLYENNKKFDEEVSEILKPYIEDGIVTHILWPYPYTIYNYKLKSFWPNDSYSYTQLTQINHSIYKYSDNTEWILSCDIDEYFYSPIFKNINELFHFLNFKKIISSIKISGFWFGATEKEFNLAKEIGVLRSFCFSEENPTSSSKCIFNTSNVKLASVHNFVFGYGDEFVISPNKLKFNHYRGIGWKKRFNKNFAREKKDIEILSKL